MATGDAHAGAGAGAGSMQRIRLRTVLTVAIVAGFIVVYFGAAAIVDVGASRSLATPVDGWIPFVPEAVFVYAWVYTGALLPLFTLRSDALLVRVALAYAILLAVAFVAYVAFPVSAVALRADAQALDMARFADWGIALVYRLDPPINLFPSIHVGLSTVAALAALRVWPRYAIAAIPWTVAIALSACMTKQHYALDVLAGAVLGVGALRLALWNAAPVRDDSPLAHPPHYGWLGPLLQLALYVAVLCIGYAVFRAA